MRNKLKNPFFLFVLGLGITLFIFSIYPAVRITNAQSDEAIKCFQNNDYEDENCIQAFIDDCKNKFENVPKRPKNLVIPACDQTPDTLKTIEYPTGKDNVTELQQFDEYCYPVRSCGLNDFVQLFVDLAKWGWWILPALALLMFVWGGFLLLSSGGNPEKIQQGKKMLTSVLVGGIIVLLLAWVITGLVISMLTGEKGGLIFGKPWFGSGGEVSANTGCCITEFECKENMTNEMCKKEPLYVNWVPRQPCFEKGSTAYTTCKGKINVGCCVPKDPADKKCVIPNPIVGCPKDTSTTPPTEIYNQVLELDCPQIDQCLPTRQPNGGETSRCCVPTNWNNPLTPDCLEISSSMVCASPEYKQIDGTSCSKVGECLGCCYNNTATSCTNNSLRSTCPNPALYWKHRQICTPYQCGLTCCSSRCGRATPNVDRNECLPADNKHGSGLATGECSSRQLAVAVCEIGGVCFENVNYWWCEQSSGTPPCYVTSCDLSLWASLNCPDTDSDGNYIEHILDCT